MCNKAILENDGILTSFPHCYKNQEMRNKAADNYPHALEFVPECYKTQNMCDKVVDTHLLQWNAFLKASRGKQCVSKQFIFFLVFDSIPDQYKTQEICDIVFLIVLILF